PPVISDDPACMGLCSNTLAPRLLCRTTTAVLAWAILVESALLNERLAEDMRESGSAKGHASGLAGACAGPFYGPDPAPEARAAFNDYVRRRWSIRVFALDPVTQEQNVEEQYAQRREMQVAMAMAFASGRSSSQVLARYARRLETDLATISLNKTAVGFTHGHDTFGWRFYPRIQPPPTRGNLATFTDTLCGTSPTARDLASRRLEPGMRECTALIVMPSFVPFVSFDVRTNWFSLTHPKATDQSMRQAMLLSRSVQSMHERAATCRGSALLARRMARASRPCRHERPQCAVASPQPPGPAGRIVRTPGGISARSSCRLRSAVFTGRPPATMLVSCTLKPLPTKNSTVVPAGSTTCEPYQPMSSGARSVMPVVKSSKPPAVFSCGICASIVWSGSSRSSCSIRRRSRALSTLR
ncbi:MAG: hypothetical protein ACKOHK_01490, partial [Planctomycetia bacterium]